MQEMVRIHVSEPPPLPCPRSLAPHVRTVWRPSGGRNLTSSQAQLRWAGRVELIKLARAHNQAHRTRFLSPVSGWPAARRHTIGAAPAIWQEMTGSAYEANKVARERRDAPGRRPTKSRRERLFCISSSADVDLARANNSGKLASCFSSPFLSQPARSCPFAYRRRTTNTIGIVGHARLVVEKCFPHMRWSS